MAVEEKNKETEVVKETPKAATQEFFEEKAKEAQETGEDQIIDLKSKIKVEFLEDVGFMKKGMKQEISQTAFDTYNLKKKIVKELR